VPVLFLLLPWKQEVEDASGLDSVGGGEDGLACIILSSYIVSISSLWHERLFLSQSSSHLTPNPAT
jgi:hypothetical protein